MQGTNRTPVYHLGPTLSPFPKRGGPHPCTHQPLEVFWSFLLVKLGIPFPSLWILEHSVGVSCFCEVFLDHPPLTSLDLVLLAQAVLLFTASNQNILFNCFFLHKSVIFVTADTCSRTPSPQHSLWQPADTGKYSRWMKPNLIAVPNNRIQVSGTPEVTYNPQA